ncbi:MAG: hypothetical protein AABX52_02325 [Nanoarchaeota archaeon]
MKGGIFFNHLKYSDLKIEEETLEIKIKVPEIKDYVNVFYLSQGARDQLYFTLRTVMSDLLSCASDVSREFELELTRLLGMVSYECIKNGHK